MSQLPQTYGLAGAIQSTAGAVPVRNEKGEIYMKKVKVHRYISGKRPEYAQYESSGEESDEENFVGGRHKPDTADDVHSTQPDVYDPRLRRLAGRERDEYEGDRFERHRIIHEPTVLESESEQSDASSTYENTAAVGQRSQRRISLERSNSEDDTDLSDSEIERRRIMLRQKALQKKQEEELLAKEEEKQESSDESSGYEDVTESDEGEDEPRLKPVFVSKKNRATIIAKERELEKQKKLEQDAKRAAKERRRQTLRLVEDTVKKELERVKADNDPNLGDCNTDDDNDEFEYESWKLRELKRIKRDREEKEKREKEKQEIERLRNLTEEERKQELRSNPKTITNKAAKGKYKFLQKYYHRGAFYLDNEDDVYRRNFSEPTLEDHFDKTILPKVMQVKNFGRCGRTKYTHLAAEDTTKFDSAWTMETPTNIKFISERAGGMKQSFEKPSAFKRKRTT